MLRLTAKRLTHKLINKQYEPLNFVELHEKHLLHNVDLLRQLNSGLGIIPVLKANAYGHGLVEIAEMLNKAHCPFVAVDGYFEASKILGVTKHPILVMGYIRPANIRLLNAKRCSFVVQDTQGLEAFGKLSRPVKIHIELNTGMNRLGLRLSELDDYLKTLKKYPSLKLEGVMSHLADADNAEDSQFTNAQVTLFDQMVERIYESGYRPSVIHLAQTAGSTKARSHYANTMRLGIGLYGINPLASQDTHFHDLDKLLPVMEIKSTIIKVIDLKKGDRVSYNGIFTAPGPMRIGVLPFGYYEGLPRELSDKGSILYEGQILPIVGRVCMNHTMVDLKNTDVRVDSPVTVISADPAQPNSVARICSEHNLFSYTLVTGISSSIRRKVL